MKEFRGGTDLRGKLVPRSPRLTGPGAAVTCGCPQSPLLRRGLRGLKTDYCRLKQASDRKGTNGGSAEDENERLSAKIIAKSCHRKTVRSSVMAITAEVLLQGCS